MLMNKISKEVETINNLGLNSLQNFLESNYINSRGKEYKCYSHKLITRSQRVT